MGMRLHKGFGPLYRENIGNKRMMNIGTWLHAYIIENEGYIRYISNNSVYGRTVGMYKNLGGGVSSEIIGIICLLLVGIGLNDVTKMGVDLPPCSPVPTALYGKTTIKFD